MSNQPYSNKSGRKVLEYYPPNSFMLDLPINLTRSKILTRCMPHLLMEDSRTTPINLLNVRNSGSLVYLDVQELVSKRNFTLSWNMDFEGSYWLWTLANLDTLMNLP